MESFKRQFIASLLGFAAQRNVDVDMLCTYSNIEGPEGVHKTDFTISPAQTNNLWRHAEQLSEDPLFGLHFGESMQLSALGVIGQVILTSNTVGEALSQAGKLIFMITDRFKIEVAHGTDSFTISFKEDKEKSEEYFYTYKHMGTYLLAFVLYELDGLLLKKIKPIKAGLPFEPDDRQEYIRVLRTSDIALSESYDLILEKNYLTLPIITSNYRMQQFFLKQIDDLLLKESNKGLLKDRVCNHLLGNSYLLTPSLDDVAANFNMSPRTLQRKLKAERITFLDIVENVRKILAIKYLVSGHYQVKDVAYTLGYSEPSGFVRAFKRWTGKKPSEFMQV